MTKLQWAGVIGALGLGIVSQIPSHNHETLPGHEHGDAMATMSVDSGPATVTLNVTGMT